jgi:phosphoribosylanthranilate isomerase
MKVKVCGMKQPDNIRGLVDIGPDMMGLIFYERSPRFVNGLDSEVVAGIPARMRKVGVFVNPELEYVLGKAEQFGLDLVQLHGDERPGFCAAVEGFVPVIKAFRVDEDFDFSVTNAYQDACEYFLFDAKGKSYGGNGVKYSWELLAQYKGETPFFLSGGLGPDDVQALRSFSHPRLAGVDLNSGFETAPGEKDLSSVEQFIKQYHG